MAPAIPHPSLSRELQSPADVPTLVHSLHEERSSVLSLAASDRYIFSGSQAQDISVWCKRTFQLKDTLRGHAGSVLALEYAKTKEWLFSSSGDSTVRIWSTATLTPLYVLEPYPDSGAGDLFSLTFAPSTQTLYIGCQNTSVQWYDFSSLGDYSQNSEPIADGNSDYTRNTLAMRDGHESPPHHSGTSTPVGRSMTPTTRKAHKFFDSYPQYERRPADIYANNPCCLSISTSSPVSTCARVQEDRSSGSSPAPTMRIKRGGAAGDGGLELNPLSSLRASGSVHDAEPLMLSVPAENVIDSAHYGYVYCMALVPSSGSERTDGQKIQLVTGSGDETVKLWDISPFSPNKPESTHTSPRLLHTFNCEHGAVLSLVVRRSGDGTVFAGCQDGYVKVLDLETRVCVRTIIVIEGVDILSLSLLGTDLYTCSANGQIQRWSSSFDCTASWNGHEGIVLSSIITRVSPTSEDGAQHNEKTKRWQLVTGGNDDYIKVWEVEEPEAKDVDTHAVLDVNSKSMIETMNYALSKFVAIPSVSSDPAHREDCRQTAIWLKKCLNQLGAQAALLPTKEGTNPLVLGTFSGIESEKVGKKPRVLFYGHYDVISAPPDGWDTDPFTLTGRNGYLYGRGATDDKGPIIAVACAAAELLMKRSLGLDLVFLIEGEEECGSTGFEEAVRKHKDQIGPIDAIFVSNSTWIAESPPCITYGLRGVVHCALEISSNLPDLHSGIEGGAVAEPMLDMVRLLATLTDSKNRVQIPEFYSHVRPQTEDERRLYTRLSALTQRPASSLASKWCEPSLTVHNIEISGPRNATVIPSKVKSQVSIRIVPDQDLNTIAKSLSDHLESSFRTLKSPNKLKVRVEHRADWWLGKLDDAWFEALENAVHDEWGVEPLRIREGGSIPSVPYLEKEFGCHALHLPLGQSSDQAHLPNERISLVNLQRGKAVIERFFLNVVEKGI